MRSLKTLETLSLVTVALLSAASAGAQPVARPPVEIGAGAGALVSWWGAVSGADLRATFPVNARHAVETFVAVAPIGEQLCGLYGIQVKRVIRRSSDSALQIPHVRCSRRLRTLSRGVVPVHAIGWIGRHDARAH